ncbi:MAG TPA: outer membrane protein assembly factor BamE [Stellaceae bacterium]|nr:outer membrane protein assembly factor BamE [Stellaceae bacterium]
MVDKMLPLSRFPVLALIALAMTVTLAGCGPPNDLRGNNPDKKVMAEIKPGVTDKVSVTKLLGSPSSVATFDKNTWYYISQETQNVAFFKPRLKDEKVVSISFNDQGIVKQIAYLGMDDHVDVVPNPNATPAPGREFTILEQLIGNFGRFSGTEPTSGGPSPTSGSGPGY